MKPVIIALVTLVLAITSACSHSEPKLADELALQDLEKTELASSAPEKSPVTSDSLDEMGTPAFAPATVVAPKVTHKKAFKKHRSKYLAKAKKKSHKKHKRH